LATHVLYRMAPRTLPVIVFGAGVEPPTTTDAVVEQCRRVCPDLAMTDVDPCPRLARSVVRHASARFLRTMFPDLVGNAALGATSAVFDGGYAVAAFAANRLPCWELEHRVRDNNLVPTDMLDYGLAIDMAEMVSSVCLLLLLLAVNAAILYRSWSMFRFYNWVICPSAHETDSATPKPIASSILPPV
jgi:hypothetical protein